MEILISIFISFFLVFPISSYCRSVENCINMDGLRKSGDAWEVYDQKIDDKSGHIKVHHDKWLMYFLHWRPLTEENKNLTPQYVRNHLLNFWGESINFKLTNIDGEMEVCEHKALFTEATFGSGVVYTRFIVWNCPKTNRQFTADCNINMRRGTSKELLELQKLITKTICCHKGAKQYVVDKLPQKYESSKWELSFYIPKNWRTADFDVKEWFPDGMTKENGSLWALLTDSQKHVELLWEETDKKISPSLFNKFLGRVSADTSIKQDSTVSLILDIQLDSLEHKNNYYLGNGTYNFKVIKNDKSNTVGYRFKGLLWRREKYAYFLLASLVQVKEFWGIENDLTPSNEIMENYLKNEIIPNIKVFNKGY